MPPTMTAPPAPRTEVQVVADAVLALLRKGYLNRAQTTGVLRTVGIRQHDLVAALERFQTRGDQYAAPVRVAADDEPTRPRRGVQQPHRPHHQQLPDPTPAPTPPPPTPEPTGQRRIPPTQQRRERRELDGVDHLLCAGCDRWIPEGEFLERSDRPGVRVSRCCDCRRRYQRARRVSTKVLDDMAQVGVAIRVDDESNLVGLACAGCGRPLKPGDELRVHGTPLHSTCEVAS